MAHEHVIIHDDLTGDLTRLPVGDGGGTGDHHRGIITDGGYRLHHTGQCQAQGGAGIRGQTPVLRCDRFPGGHIGDLGPQIVGPHEAGDHRGQGGVAADHHDAQGLLRVLGGRLRGAEVRHIRLPCDLIQGRRGVMGEHIEGRVVEHAQVTSRGHLGEIMHLGCHGSAGEIGERRGCTTQDNKTHMYHLSIPMTEFGPGPSSME